MADHDPGLHLRYVAQLLEEGWEPHDITMERVVSRAMIAHIRMSVGGELAMRNIRGPSKEGRDADPAWYVAQGILTAFIEGLDVVLRDVMRESEPADP